MDIKEVFDKFLIIGEYKGASSIENGNINTTYKVVVERDGKQHNYIFQRINRYVFVHPEEVMENIYSVTEFVRAKIKASGLHAKRRVVHCILTKTGRKYFLDDMGEYWRCYMCIEDAVTYDETSDLFIVEQTGCAFGEFQNHLAEYDASILYETIPNFHNTEKRYKVFEEVVKADEYKRAESVADEIGYLRSLKVKATRLNKLLAASKLPLKVTHNDTKSNNVMFDKVTNEAIAVLDLDTVMPGIIAYDYGDGVRYICNSVDENEKDISKVYLDLNKFEAFTRGFLSLTKDSLSTEEKSTLVLGVLTMTVELAVRFLTDYLYGDKYFKIRFAEHNLVRARVQIALARDIEKKYSQMGKIVKKYCK